MECLIKVLGKDKQNISTWSGGTTTELAIYPEGTSYKERDFAWRLSSANVDLDESTFTSLPGIWRYIMVIEGEMELEHEGYHKIYLKPYEQDSFSGEWVTRSKGRVRDFNLMLKAGYRGRIEAVCIGDEAVVEKLSPCKDCNSYTQAIYCTEGDIKIEINKNQNAYAQKGDLAIIDFEEVSGDAHIKITNCNNNISKIIKATICK